MGWYPSLRWPLIRVAVRGPSMAPTLRHGDWLIALRTSRIRAGQIVLASHPGRPGLQLVKRAGGRSEGGWWLVSDFPDAPGAADSRQFGPVAPERVAGRVLARYWPDPKLFIRNG